ncbi:MAG TPA: hypothetical protein VGA45_01525, partial [Actinomycetota bacterium]
MIGSGRQRRVYLLGSLLLLAASLHPTTAYSAPGDPPSGSPAGAVYELPLQQGRADAAPKGGAPGSGATGDSTGGSDGGGGESGSLYRTENNFGSSSKVPGLAAAGGAGDGAGGIGGDGSASGRGGGGGGGTIAGGAIAGDVADSGNTSVAAGLALLGAIALLAAAVAVLSRR